MSTGPARFFQLVEKYLEGKLTPDERQALKEMLAAEAGFRAQFIAWVEQEAALRAIYSKDRVASGQSEADPVPHDQNEPVRLMVPGRSRRWWITGVAAALLLAFGVSLWLLRPRSVAASALAHLEEVQGEVYVVAQDGRIAARAGQELFPGQGLHVVGEESSAVVLYPDATRLEVGAGTILAELAGGPDTGKKLFLAEGYLTAEVVKQPPDRPMVLATPHAEVLVLGTKFSLADGREATYLEIEKGTVQLTRKSDGSLTEVGAGFDAVATSGREPLVAQPRAPRSRTPRLTLEGYWTAAPSPDGQTLAATKFPGGTVELWDATTGQLRATLRGHTHKVNTVVFSPDGKTLATGSVDHTVKLWDVASGRLEATFGDHPPPIEALAFSADGKVLTVLTSKKHAKTVTLWDLSTRQRRLAYKSDSTKAWALSPDGQTLATAREEETTTVMLWDIPTGQSRVTLRGVTETVLGMVFSPDGTRLAVYSNSGIVTLWDTVTGKVLGTLRAGFGGKILGMACSPDSQTLATGHLDSTVRLWDVASGKQRAALEGHTARLHVVDFGPGGKTLVTSDREPRGTVRFWDLPAP